MSDLLNRVRDIGIIPVIKLNSVEQAVPLAKALINGGLPCAEVTFRTAAAEEAISLMAKEYPEMLLGAGTVLTTEQVDKAVNAGAKFIVSPGFDPEIVDYCIKENLVLDTLSLEKYKEFSDIFDEDLYNEISLETCVAKRISAGSTGPDSVNTQIKYFTEFLNEKGIH